MIDMLLVALGAGTGAVSRYLLSQVGKMYHFNFPWATFVTNLSGTFIIGLLTGLSLSQGWHLALVTGFCGGFTTFSTFNAELVILLRDHQTARAMVDLLASVIAGVMLLIVGLWLGQLL